MRWKKCLCTSCIAIFITALSFLLFTQKESSNEDLEDAYVRRSIQDWRHKRRLHEWESVKNRFLKSGAENSKWANSDLDEFLLAEERPVRKKHAFKALKVADRSDQWRDQDDQSIIDHQGDQSRYANHQVRNDQPVPQDDQSIIDRSNHQSIIDHRDDQSIYPYHQVRNDQSVPRRRSDQSIIDQRDQSKDPNPQLPAEMYIPEQNAHPTESAPKSTIVTGIFDIGRGNWSLYRRPYSMYQDYMRRLLALDIYLVVFADPDGAKFVRQHRSGMMEKTIIQEMTIKQLPLYAHYERIKDLIDKEQANWKPEWDHSMRAHPESISAEYDILMNSKAYFVYYVANWNPFKSEYFYWLDAGYGHGQAQYPPAGSRWAPENLMTPEIGGKITFIQLGPSELRTTTLKDMYRQGATLVNGGFFGANKRALEEYYHLHQGIFQSLLNKGYVDDDQTLTILCYNENPPLFNMVVGDWYDVFKLFHPSDHDDR